MKLDFWNKHLSCATAFLALTLTVGATMTPDLARANDEHRALVCNSFAKAAVDWEWTAIEGGCDIRGARISIFEKESRAFSWCMGTSEAEFKGRSPKAAGHKKEIERHCSRQLGRPFKM